MSEVKLYVPLSKDVINRCYMKTTYRPATTAEIMEAHPKCGECRYSDTNKHYNTTDCVIDPRYIRVVSKDKDYCRHWEGKG